MPLPERHKDLLVGEPGAVVNEDIGESGKSRLYYTYHDGNGNLLYYAEFWRGASPEDISHMLNQWADELLETNPRNLPDHELLEKAKTLRELADNVPGLY